MLTTMMVIMVQCLLSTRFTWVKEHSFWGKLKICPALNLAGLSEYTSKLQFHCLDGWTLNNLKKTVSHISQIFSWSVLKVIHNLAHLTSLMVGCEWGVLLVLVQLPQKVHLGRNFFLAHNWNAGFAYYDVGAATQTISSCTKSMMLVSV